MRHLLLAAVLAATLLTAACSPSSGQDYPGLRDKIATEVQALVLLLRVQGGRRLVTA